MTPRAERFAIQFGRLVTKQRQAARLLAHEAAAALGISASKYSRIERGEVAVKLDVMLRITDFFGIEVRLAVHPKQELFDQANTTGESVTQSGGKL